MEEITREYLAASEPIDGVVCVEKFVPGPRDAPNVRVLIYSPSIKEQLRPAFLHIHGGGFIMGSPELLDGQNRRLARDLDCVVVSVDYRLAPETVFPGAVEDCYAALKWLHANAMQLGADPRRIAIGGESGGGTLSAGLALLARDRGEVPIIHQSLVYPALNDRLRTAPHTYLGEFITNLDQTRFFWTAYLGHQPGAKDVSPYAAPSRALDVAGLPSTFISACALDLLLEEDLEYARRLADAGVPVELHVYQGTFHAFDIAAPESRLGKKHARDRTEALRHAFEK
jgi:acetyl esterase/lipase